MFYRFPTFYQTRLFEKMIEAESEGCLRLVQGVGCRELRYSTTDKYYKMGAFNIGLLSLTPPE